MTYCVIDVVLKLLQRPTINHASKLQTASQRLSPTPPRKKIIHKSRDSIARPARPRPLPNPKRAHHTRNGKAMSTRVLRSALRHDFGNSFPLRRSARIASRVQLVSDIHDDNTRTRNDIFLTSTRFSTVSSLRAYLRPPHQSKTLNRNYLMA